MRLPYVTEERLPSGATRYRFRRGTVKVTLRGEPGSREFLEHYSKLRDGVPVVASKAIKNRLLGWPGSISRTSSAGSETILRHR